MFRKCGLLLVVALVGCSQDRVAPAEASSPQMVEVRSADEPRPAPPGTQSLVGKLADEKVSTRLQTQADATPAPAQAPAAAAAAAPKSIVCKIGSPGYGAGGAILGPNSCGRFVFQPSNCVRGDNGGVNAYPDSRYHGVISSFDLQGGMNSFRIDQPSAASLPGGYICCGGGNGGGPYGPSACYGLYFEARFDKLAD